MFRELRLGFLYFWGALVANFVQDKVSFIEKNLLASWKPQLFIGTVNDTGQNELI
jgi:hypothetical protein